MNTYSSFGVNLQITKTTRTVNQRRLSSQKSVDEPEPPKLKMLYGRDLKEYDNVDVESLLAQLTTEELEALSEEVDPDDALLPPSQRCKDQTTKTATGPLNRKKLLTFLTEYAKQQEDWPELKPFQSGVKRGERWSALLSVFISSVCLSVCDVCRAALVATHPSHSILTEPRNSLLAISQTDLYHRSTQL